MCDARRKHAVFPEARIDYPWVFGDIVPPIISVIIVSLLPPARWLIRHIAVVHGEGFSAWGVGAGGRIIALRRMT